MPVRVLLSFVGWLMRITIEGPVDQAERVAEEITAFIRGELGVPLERVAEERMPAPDRSLGDVLAFIGLVLALPQTVVATAEIVQWSRERLEAWRKKKEELRQRFPRVEVEGPHDGGNGPA